MRSRTSFFNAGISKNLLRRCWPLWSCYFGLLIIGTVLPLASRWVSPGDNLNYELLTNGSTMLFFAAAVAVLTAMCMFSYLYNSRACGMINSLPVKRETVFWSAYLTGLVPLLFANGLAAALLIALLRPRVLIAMRYAAMWFGMTSLGMIAFYGLAVFCAMLTGSIIILPILYVVVNFAACVVEICIEELLYIIIYGFVKNGDFSFASRLFPVMGISEGISITREYTDAAGKYHLTTLSGWWVLIAFAVGGIALSYFAMLLCKNREMETAGDSVAIPILKPAFKYCMAVGCALVLAAGLYDAVFYRLMNGTGAAILLAFLMLVGAFIGWYAAEMVITRTVRVFRSGCKGLLIVCGAILCLTVLCETDAFGYERRIPEASEIESVTAMNGIHDYNADGLTEPESLAAALRLHQSIVQQKKENESAEYTQYVTLTYKLKNGRTLKREYRLANEASHANDPASSVRLCEELFNMPEAVEQRLILREGRTLRDCYYYVNVYWQENGVGYGWNSDEEFGGDGDVIDLYENAVLPDLREGKIGRVRLCESEENDAAFTNVEITIVCRNKPQDTENRFYQYISISLPFTAERTLEWVQTHTDAEIMPFGEATLVDDLSFPEEKFIIDTA